MSDLIASDGSSWRWKGIADVCKFVPEYPCLACFERLTLPTEGLFVTGDFTLHSGGKSDWKIDCDALTISDVDTLALVAARSLPPFDEVVGIPRGGTALADALKQYRVRDVTLSVTLIVDDVLTTGKSMKEARKKHGKDSIGLVIFAHATPPKWVRAMFTYSL